MLAGDVAGRDKEIDLILTLALNVIVRDFLNKSSISSSKEMVSGSVLLIQKPSPSESLCYADWLSGCVTPTRLASAHRLA